MILPTKHISSQQCLLGLGAQLLKELERENTVTGLWGIARTNPDIRTFERFVSALDFLYIIGAIELNDGLLRRCEA